SRGGAKNDGGRVTGLEPEVADPVNGAAGVGHPPWIGGDGSGQGRGAGDASYAIHEIDPNVVALDLPIVGNGLGAARGRDRQGQSHALHRRISGLVSPRMRTGYCPVAAL